MNIEQLVQRNTKEIPCLQGGTAIASPPMARTKTLAEKWLWLGVTALAVAGVFAILLVVARTPQLKELAVVQSLFNVALVVHVDLSVLFWFFSVLGMGIAGLMAPFREPFTQWSKTAFYTIAAATALLTLSPLSGEWEVLQSNYIPVLFNKLFFLSLGLLAAGLIVLLLPALYCYASVARLRLASPVERGWLAAGACVLLALVGFGLSAYHLPGGLDRHDRFETLFWAGGHIWQFAFALLMMAAWLGLLEARGNKPLPAPLVTFCYLAAMAGALMSLLGFAIHPFDSGDFTYFQTRMMIEVGGLGASVLALGTFCRMAFGHSARSAPTRAYSSALVMSLLLFAAGGALGVMISGQNVGIPAHYHGEIVGITLALMGYAYAMLPRFGYRSVAGNRLAFWQPIVYGVGQLFHIGGLAYSGGYGVLRKTAGGFENLAPEVKAALGIMGLGGLIAIIGGILFVVVVLRARRHMAA